MHLRFLDEFFAIVHLKPYNEINSLSVEPKTNHCMFEFYEIESYFVFGKSVSDLLPNLPYKRCRCLKMAHLRLTKSVFWGP